MKTLIVRDIGDQKVWNFIPSNNANASTLAQKYLKGYWEVYKKEPLDFLSTPEPMVKKIRLIVENTSVGKKAYFNFFCNARYSSDEIRNRLLNSEICHGFIVNKVTFLEITPINY